RKKMPAQIVAMSGNQWITDATNATKTTTRSDEPTNRPSGSAKGSATVVQAFGGGAAWRRKSCGGGGGGGAWRHAASCGGGCQVHDPGGGGRQPELGGPGRQAPLGGGRLARGSGRGRPKPMCWSYAARERGFPSVAHASLSRIVSWAALGALFT